MNPVWFMARCRAATTTFFKVKSGGLKPWASDLKPHALHDAHVAQW